jgi:hypothetical protein
MRLFLAVAYWSLFVWWNSYLATTEPPGEIIGTLICLAGSLYLVNFTMIATIELFLGPVRDYYDNNAPKLGK